MLRIDKVLATTKREVKLATERRNNHELKQAISRMTTEQLAELVDGDPSEDRLKEILESVGGLHLLESG